MPQTAHAAEIKVVSGGAFKQVLNALAAQYRKDSGNTFAITYRTVGQHLDLILNGKEPFDVAILTPEAIERLIKDGKVTPGTRTDLAKTGIGVVVKAGTPLPDISTVDAFKQSLLAAKSVAYIDPKAGGSSGIYVAALLQRLGIAGQVNAKAVLVHGGAVADHVADGEAELGIHQISEILPVAGVSLGRSAAGRDPEFYGLCGRARRRGQVTVPRPRRFLSSCRARRPCRSSRPKAWSPRRVERASKRQRPAEAGRRMPILQSGPATAGVTKPRISDATAPTRSAECRRA